MSWEILKELLLRVRSHETSVGKVWLSVVLIFRLLVLVVVAEEVFEDEQKEFVCNTKQPGCQTVCYDYFFPVSPIRFWALQVIVVSTPTLFILVHIASRHARDQTEEMKGGLILTHEITALTKFLVECGSVGLYWNIYAKVGLIIPRLLKCFEAPCPSQTDCFVPRASEKTAFSGFMLLVSGICAFVNLLELMYIPYQRCRGNINKALKKDSDTEEGKTLNVTKNALSEINNTEGDDA